MIFFLILKFTFLNSTEINIDLGPGIVFSQSIYKSKNDRIIPIPFIKINYSKIYVYGTEISYELYKLKNINLLTSVKWEPSGFSPNDGYFLEGMRKRNDEINFKTAILHRLKYIRISFENSYNLISSKKSYSYSLSISSRIPLQKNLNIIPSLKLEYENKNKSNTKYGVFQYETNTLRNEYLPGKSKIFSLNINIAKALEKKSLIIINSFKFLPSNITKSPIISKSVSFTSIIAILFNMK